MYRGLDLKKWYSWLIGLYGFLVGFWLGIVWSDINNALMAGIIFAFAPLYQGAINHWRRDKDKKALEAWLESPEAEKKHPLLKRFVEWFSPK
jgi:4-hydroxybenzoate polyprenyltransferase